MANSSTENAQQSQLWGLGEPEYLVAIIGLIAVLGGLIVVVLKEGDAKIFAAFTTVVGTIAGHALGGAGRRRAVERAHTAVGTAERRAGTLRAVLCSSDIEVAKRIAQDGIDDARA
jgi:hypothetical protein